MEVPKMEPPLIAHLPTAGGQMMTSLSTRERYVTFLSATILCSNKAPSTASSRTVALLTTAFSTLV
jgi:hypothetical protein